MDINYRISCLARAINNLNDHIRVEEQALINCRNLSNLSFNNNPHYAWAINLTEQNILNKNEILLNLKKNYRILTDNFTNND